MRAGKHRPDRHPHTSATQSLGTVLAVIPQAFPPPAAAHLIPVGPSVSPGVSLCHENARSDVVEPALSG